MLDSLRTIRDAVNPCATAGSAETATAGRDETPDSVVPAA
jgi:hypothetical protein